MLSTPRRKQVITAAWLKEPLIQRDDLPENFTRPETFGSPNVHWVKVTVEPAAPDLLTLHPMLVKGN